MSKVEQFILRRGSVSEAFSVQHTIFVTTNISEVVRPGPDLAGGPGADAASTSQAEPRFCRWAFEVYMQRQSCFTSISGVTGCTDPVTTQFPEVESGDYEFDPSSPNEAACDDNHPLVATARQRVEQRIRSEGQALMAADTRSGVLAGMAKIGLTVEKR